MTYVIAALAVYRLTRLVGADAISDPIRARLPDWLWFVECPWCISVYVAAGYVAMAKYESGWFHYVADLLAFSAVAGLLAQLPGGWGDDE